jgi:hypothetical protein
VQFWQSSSSVAISRQVTSPKAKFIIKQLAGDVLSGTNRYNVSTDATVGTGFLALVPKTSWTERDENQAL